MPRRPLTATAANPAPDPELRRSVRNVLDLLPDGRRATVEMLVSMVNDLRPIPVDARAVTEALNWNHDRQFVNFERNKDLDRDEWFITSMGRIKVRQG